MKPAVSICIPAYKQPALLERTVASALAQDFEDFEIIVTDDSEDDAISAVLQQWKHDPRVRYFHNAARLGSPANWNEAMRHARSDLIKFMHHDDWFAEPFALGTFVAALRDNPAADFAFSAANACEDDGSIIFVHKPSLEQVAELRRSPSALLFCNFIGPPSSSIFRKSDFLFDEKLKWVVDIDAYMHYIKKNPHVIYLDSVLINVSSNGAHQVTRELASAPALRIAENLYLYSKHRPSTVMERWRAVKSIWNLMQPCKDDVFNEVEDIRAMHSKSLEEKMVFLVKKVMSKLRTFKNGHPNGEASHRMSYSQCGEDCIIDFLFMWLGISDVRYLDIGAHHPTWLSNTYFFYCKGNRGVLVEPDADLCPSLREKRPGDIVLNVAVGVTEGEDVLPMYVMASRTLNTLDKQQAEALHASGDDHIEVIRDVRRVGINLLLAEFFTDNAPNFVSLDVEGLDLSILQAWDFSRFRPKVFCVETLTYTRDNTEKKLTQIIEYMTNNDYRLYADTYINSIFVDNSSWEKRPVHKED